MVWLNDNRADPPASAARRIAQKAMTLIARMIPAAQNKCQRGGEAFVLASCSPSVFMMRCASQTTGEFVTRGAASIGTRKCHDLGFVSGDCSAGNGVGDQWRSSRRATKVFDRHPDKVSTDNWRGSRQWPVSGPYFRYSDSWQLIINGPRQSSFPGLVSDLLGSRQMEMESQIVITLVSIRGRLSMTKDRRTN